MNPPVEAPGVEAVAVTRIDAEPIERRPQLLPPARDEAARRADHLRPGRRRRPARRPSWPGSRRRSPVPRRPRPAPPRDCSPALGARARRRAADGARSRVPRMRSSSASRVDFLAAVFFAADFLAVERRPDAVMPARRSRSRTRFFTASRSACVATPTEFIWEETSREIELLQAFAAPLRPLQHVGRQLRHLLLRGARIGQALRELLRLRRRQVADHALRSSCGPLRASSSGISFGRVRLRRPAYPRRREAPLGRGRREERGEIVADERRHETAMPARSSRRAIPVRTRSESHPSPAAPAMSVSRRSPITSGVPPPARSSAASMIGGSGLPNTSARAPVVVSIDREQRARPRPVPIGRRVRGVGVRGEQRRSALDQERRPAELLVVAPRDPSRPRPPPSAPLRGRRARSRRLAGRRGCPPPPRRTPR